jgi:hypothetical protein
MRWQRTVVSGKHPGAAAKPEDSRLIMWDVLKQISLPDKN